MSPNPMLDDLPRANRWSLPDLEFRSSCDEPIIDGGLLPSGDRQDKRSVTKKSLKREPTQGLRPFGEQPLRRAEELAHAKVGCPLSASRPRRKYRAP